MEIKILFNNKRLNRQFLVGWGISCLVGSNILFDTGEEWGCLFGNMDRMGVSIDGIEAVVISHEHFDHTGGLWELLRRKPRLDLYICSGLSRGFKDRVKLYGCNMIEVDSFAQIAGDVYTTGQMEASHGVEGIPEQALVLDTAKGLTVVTGCAHPGIIAVVERARANLKKDVRMVIGGFHLLGEPGEKIRAISNRLRDLGVRSVGPAHCTGDDAESIFRKSYQENFIDITVGKTIEV